MKSVQTKWGNVERTVSTFHWNQFRQSLATACALLETGHRNTNMILFYSSRSLKLGGREDRHVTPDVVSTKTEVIPGSRGAETD